MVRNPIKALLRSGDPAQRQQVKNAQRTPTVPARPARGAGARRPIQGWMTKKQRTRRRLSRRG